MPTLLLFAIAAAPQSLLSQDAGAKWQDRIETSRKLIEARKNAEARTLLEQVRQQALQTRNDEAALAALRLLVTVARSEGDWPRTEDLLNEELDFARRVSPTKDDELAAVYSELAAARRAQRKLPEAVAALQAGLLLRGKETVPTPDLARDSTSLGLIHIDLKKPEEARAFFLTAVNTWNKLLRDDPEVLGALEPLAGLLRDASEYADAEPLYQRALRIREIAFGADSAEVLGGLDNLAYCYFGERKFEEAEPLYKRVLSLWEITAGPEHPMVALTLDKMVIFYAEQKRFDEAEPLAERAVQIRAKGLVSAYRGRANLAAKQDKGQAAVDWIAKAEAIRDITRLPKPEQKPLPLPRGAHPAGRTAPPRAK